jgi:HEPN domain-containing protein
LSAYSDARPASPCYPPAVTDTEVIAHWRKGAWDELTSARLLCDGGQYPAALFHCHLAVEKALKARFMAQHGRDAPLTHDLPQIALQLDRGWTDAEKQDLADLTAYAIAARYDDPLWAQREATAEKAEAWIQKVDALLTTLLP